MTTLVLLLLAIQTATLIVVFVLLRRPSSPAEDHRLNQLANTMAAQLTRLDAHFEGLDRHLRNELAQLRTEAATEAHRTRESAAADFSNLRAEVTKTIAELSNLLQTGLNAFRADNKTSDETLRTAVQHNLDSIEQRLSYFIAEVKPQSARGSRSAAQPPHRTLRRSLHPAGKTPLHGRRPPHQT